MKIRSTTLRQMKISVPDTWDKSKRWQHLQTRKDKMIRYFRELRDKSQGRYSASDLALRCKVAIDVVRSWERGKAPPVATHSVISAYERALLSIEAHEKTSFPKTQE